MPPTVSRSSCCVCGKKESTHPRRRLHLFPKDARRRLQWVQSLNIAYVKHTQVVCDDHFEACHMGTKGHLLSSAVPRLAGVSEGQAVAGVRGGSEEQPHLHTIEAQQSPQDCIDMAETHHPGTSTSCQLPRYDVYDSVFGEVVELHDEPLPPLPQAPMPVADQPSANTHHVPHDQDQHYATERFLSALDECSAEDEGGGDFTYSATLLLIECIKDRFEKFCSTRYWRNRVYKDVQEELAMYSYNFSIEKIRSKWSNLVTTYKRIKCRHKSSRAARRVWEYYQQLDDLLGPSFESSAPTRVSVTTAKPRSTHTVQQQSPASNTWSCRAPESFEEPNTSPPLASSLTWPQGSVGKPDASGSLTIKKHDATPSYLHYKVEQGDKREEMMGVFLQQINEKEIREYNYKKRKERRDRLKLKALQKMVCKLEAINKIQEDILKKQDSLLETIHESVLKL